ncbi:MAG: hypothetical protein ACPGNV_12530 [Mangrovicoccus sp.]
MVRAWAFGAALLASLPGAALTETRRDHVKLAVPFALLPYAQAEASAFAAEHPFKFPELLSARDSAMPWLFCRGGVSDSPDMGLAFAPLSAEISELCATFGKTDLTQMAGGGMQLSAFALTSRDLAGIDLAELDLAELSAGDLSWQDLRSDLPDAPLRFYLPGDAARLAFAQALAEQCSQEEGCAFEQSLASYESLRRPEDLDPNGIYFIPGSGAVQLIGWSQLEIQPQIELPLYLWLRTERIETVIGAKPAVKALALCGGDSAC